MVRFIHDSKRRVCTELEGPLLNELQYPLADCGVRRLGAVVKNDGGLVTQETLQNPFLNY